MVEEETVQQPSETFDNQVRRHTADYALAQLKSLASANAPEESIIASLDVLADLAQECSHPELSVYQSLRAQASRMQGKLSIAGLCLEVLAGKENDKVSNAVSKLLREEKLKKVERPAKQPSPQAQLSQPQQHLLQTQPPAMMPYGGFPFYPSGHYQPFNMYQPGYQPGYQPHYQPPYRGRGNRRGTFQQRSRSSSTACHFCGVDGHFQKDCTAYKKMKDQNK